MFPLNCSNWWFDLLIDGRHCKTYRKQTGQIQSHNIKSGRPDRLLLWAHTLEKWHCYCRNHHSVASGGSWKRANPNVRNIISSGRTWFPKQSASGRQALVYNRFLSTALPSAHWNRMVGRLFHKLHTEECFVPLPLNCTFFPHGK